MNWKKTAIYLTIAILCLFLFLYNVTLSYPRFFNDTSNPIKPLIQNWKPNQIPKDVNIVKFELKKHNFVKGILRYEAKKIDIFVHGKNDLISKVILDSGIWEKGWIDQLVRYIKQNPGIQVIDVGCNLGVYTMIAASYGSRVIAIDANKNNTDRLAQSVINGKFEDRVTVFLNAVSDERKTFSMGLYPPNIGGQWLIDNKNHTYQVNSMFLNDLLPFVDNKRPVMMKIDVENHEIKAMKAAADLFDKTNIKLVFIEWFQVKVNPDSYIIMHFFLSRNYKAYSDFFSTKQLDVSNYNNWPYEIVWRKS